MLSCSAIKLSSAVCVATFAGQVAMAESVLIATDSDAASLVNELLGGGVTVIGTPTLTGSPAASGTFTNGIAAGIGIESGIILSTGSVQDAIGPNTSTDTGTNFGLAGDPDLDALAGDATLDAAVLEFDFTTDTGEIFFNFVFASEEYNEFTNSSFNDVFGFFVDDANIALVPGTSTPISVNTVNGGNPLGTDASNSGFFNNNDAGAFDLEYDGFTDVFTVSATGLNTGTHTIRLAIADTADDILDSAVFIQANSFGSTAPPPAVVPTPSAVLGSLPMLGYMGLRRRRRKA